jgi:hypothetical protein
MNEKPNALPCRRCGRMVRSEKDGRGGKWRIPPLKLCPNCTDHDYKIQRPTSDVFVLDTQSRNFTNYFIDNIVQ